MRGLRLQALPPTYSETCVLLRNSPAAGPSITLLLLAPSIRHQRYSTMVPSWPWNRCIDCGLVSRTAEYRTRRAYFVIFCHRRSFVCIKMDTIFDMHSNQHFPILDFKRMTCLWPNLFEAGEVNYLAVQSSLPLTQFT